MGFAYGFQLGKIPLISSSKLLHSCCDPVVLLLLSTLFDKRGTFTCSPYHGYFCPLSSALELISRAASSVGVMYRSNGRNTGSNPGEGRIRKKKNITDKPSLCTYLFTGDNQANVYTVKGTRTFYLSTFPNDSLETSH